MDALLPALLFNIGPIVSLCLEKLTHQVAAQRLPYLRPPMERWTEFWSRYLLLSQCSASLRKRKSFRQVESNERCCCSSP